MIKYANVIVDLPARQTNRTFTYIIPQRLDGWIKIGMRVSVPFANRTLLAIVIDLCTTTEVSSHKMKEIHECLELKPAFTEELITLSKWLSDQYFCSRIFSLYAMLPKALKARYHQTIRLNLETCSQTMMLTEDEQTLFEWLKTQKNITLEKTMKQFPLTGAIIRDWFDEGILQSSVQVKDQHRVQRETWLEPLFEQEQLLKKKESLRANAHQQRIILDHFIQNPEPISTAQLRNLYQLQNETVKTLVKQNVLRSYEVDKFRDPFVASQFKQTVPLQLTTEQQGAFAIARQALLEGQYHTYLLHGITGSGKTELYLQWIQFCIDLGKEAIVLVPEISLTPQMIERFKGRFGEQVAVLHSRLSDGERYDEWRKIRNRQVKVAIGARSAVFAPFEKLGCIFIDEEHETSYKQEETPKYVTREVARRRCQTQQAVLVLGSATPSLESYVKTLTNNDSYLHLSQRASRQSLPQIEIVDMRNELKEAHRSIISRSLLSHMQDRIQKNEQMIIFLNRRGYSTIVMCRSCGFVCQCPHCEIALTFHQTQQRLHCHYCGFEQPVIHVCPTCQNTQMKFFGTGTQKVEEELNRLLPTARIIRMDVDTTTTKGSHEKLLTSFAHHEADILLGTQMISKGLDFANVTLVGVINADTVLNMPDFRSAEKTFQLLTQVAGRAGRAEKAGEVVIQTYNPEHYSIQFAKNHDYLGFAKMELKYRESLHYPPFCNLVVFVLSHENLNILIRASEHFGQYAREFLQHQQQTEDCFILGPTAAPIAKLKDRYRYQCMLKYKSDFAVRPLLQWLSQHMEGWLQQHKIQMSIDVDPYVMM